MTNSQTLVEAVTKERRGARWFLFRCTECGSVLGPAVRTGVDARLVRLCPICGTPHPVAGGRRR
jgi:uncharacterized Zn finger protein